MYRVTYTSPGGLSIESSNLHQTYADAVDMVSHSMEGLAKGFERVAPMESLSYYGLAVDIRNSEEAPMNRFSSLHMDVAIWREEEAS